MPEVVSAFQQLIKTATGGSCFAPAQKELFAATSVLCEAAETAPSTTSTPPRGIAKRAEFLELVGMAIAIGAAGDGLQCDGAC